ncbi:MAG TPA: sulfotransferase family protein [Gammaproteobacteria bacterium]|nr:sulfotransferase family protein [Gammaproteobacteria bacterium]
MNVNINKINKLKKMAGMLAAENRLAEAVLFYERLCGMDPDDASAWVELGVIQRRLKDYIQAEKSCRKAVAVQPGYAPGYHALGAALQQQGRLEDALSCYREAVRLDPGCIEAHYFLANALRQAGLLSDATLAYQKLLQLKPDHFAGLNNLGTHLKNLGDIESAIRLLQRALQLQPDSIETMTNLGDAYVARSRYEEAIEILQRAVRTRPQFPNAHRALANALHHAGRLQEALDSYGEAARLVPGWREVTLAQAKIYEQLGEYGKSHDLLRPLIEAGYDGALPVYFDISKHVGQRDQAVRELERFLGERPDMRAEAAAGIHFQLGRHYDESGDYDTAFRHFEQANGLTPADFDREAQVHQVDEIIATYGEGFAERMRCADNRTDLPVFIVGMPRSGTSLVEQILASHPEVFGAGELPHISRIARRFTADYPGLTFPGLARYITRESLDTAAEQHLRALRELGGTAARVTDKMPYNLVYVGLIVQLFPGARIIQCARHPLDTCLSCYFSDFGTIGHDFSYDLKTVGEFYIQYHRLMQHWKRVFPGRVLQVSYTDLVREQERCSRELVDFCGLAWDQRCLDFHTTNRFVFTLSYEQVRQPMYTRSLERWRHYERYLRPLREQLEAAGIDCE